MIGALLLHLRDPVRGLEAVRKAMDEGGRLLLVEPILMLSSLVLRTRPVASLRAARTPFDWWVGNIATFRAWLELAGFAPPKRKKVFRLKAHKHIRQWHAALETTPIPRSG